MVKNLKRTLALMLSLIMIFSSTLMAFANDEGIITSSEENTSAQIEETVAAEEVTSAEAPAAEAVTEEKQVEAATEAVAPAAAEITAQPEDVSVYVNAEAEFAVETNSKVKSCQWQMAKSPSSTWSNLNRRQYGSSETLKIRALEKYDNWFFRCIVTFRDGSTQVSEEARLNIVEKETLPAQTFGSIKDTKVVAPEGAFPAGTTMEANEVDDTKAVQSIIDDMKGVDGSVLNAVDITFYDGNAEIQPQEAVKVTLNVGKDADFDNLTLVHIKANADDLDKDGIKAEKVEFTANKEAGTITFDADHFSTFALTWEDGTANVHWGELKDSTFTEFDSAKLDNSAASISLDVIYDGYLYAGAYYQPATGDSRELASPQLTKATVDGKSVWQITVKVATSEDASSTETITIADGTDIYAFYTEKGEGYTPPPAPPSNLDNAKPLTVKSVEQNDDGTYKVRLDITGQADQSVSQVAANVIVVMDTTTSMSYNMAGQSTSVVSERRMEAARGAMDALVEALNMDVNKVNFSLVEFNLRGETHSWGSSTWTQSAETILSYVDDPSQFNYTTATSGTNWEAGLDQCLEVLNSVQQDASLRDNGTYVIFVTDGDPNRWGNNQGGPNYDQNARAAAEAQDEANDIARASSLYGIFCGSSAGEERLRGLITAANGKATIGASSASAIKEAFKDIAQTIVEDLKAKEVVVDDGIPTLSDIGVGVSGVPKQFDYYIKPAGGTETKWAEAPSAAYSSSNGVTWDLSSAGALVDGTTYTVEFDVWPSQDAYDMIANLNNGLISPVPSADELWDMGISKDANGVYHLETNTHLNTTFNINNNTYNSIPEELVSEPMVLPTNTIKVKKIWNNKLDMEQAENVTLEITKDGKFYENIVMGAPVPIGENQWEQTPDDEIYISVGIMGCDDDGNLTIFSPGHDYTVTEPPEFSFNWDLTADIYHPMIINTDTEATILIEVPDDKVPAGLTINNNQKVTFDGLNYYKFGGMLYVEEPGHNTLTANNDRRSNLVINKVVKGTGAPEDATFPIQFTLEKKDWPHPGDADYDDWYNTMWFAVTTSPDPDEQGAIVMDEISMTGATAEYRTHIDPETGQRVPDYDDEGNLIYTGYYWFDNGGTVTVNLKAGQYICLVNQAKGTTYTVEEVSPMPDGFVFEEATSAATTTVPGQTPTPAKISGQKAEGTIDKSNSEYSVTYTNSYLGNFYVYHSSNSVVESHPIAVDGKQVTSFDIYDRFEKVAGDTTLYGGYYEDYSGKSTGFDATKLTYTADKADGNVLKSEDKGTNVKQYTYQYIKDSGKAAWNWDDAYTDDATKIVPEANAVYYLKEVPTSYLLPYTHYTYYKADLLLANLWTITAIDDLNYKKAGFIVQTDDDEAVVVNTMKIRAENSAVTTELNAGKVFQKKGVLDGYLGYYEITKYKPNKTTIVQYWDTPDGVRVYGKMMRTLTFNSEKISGLINADTAYTGPEN